MALDPSGAKLKKALEARIIAAMAREFKEEMGVNKDAAKAHKRMAAALSDIAMDIVTMLLTECQVAVGIQTAGSPASQTSVTPGKLI